MQNSVERVLSLIKEKDIKMVDFKMVDINGQFRHVTIPAENFSEETLKSGIGFDASNYGYAVVEKSDMVFIPDPDTAVVDPFCSIPTLSMTGNAMIIDTPENRPLPQYPRNIIKAAVEAMKASGVADTDNLVAIYSPKFEADPTNVELAKSIASKLAKVEGGTDTDLFIKTMTVWYDNEPSATAAYMLYKLNSSRGDIANAYKYMEAAIASADSDPDTDAGYNFELAAFAFKNGNNSKAIESANANLLNNSKVSIDPKTIRIARIFVTTGTRMRRYKPASRGRALPYEKISSNIFVEVAGEEKVKKAAEKADDTKPKKAKESKAKTEAKKEKK